MGKGRGGCDVLGGLEMVVLLSGERKALEMSWSEGCL